jgi:hypothetical protein
VDLWKDPVMQWRLCWTLILTRVNIQANRHGTIQLSVLNNPSLTQDVKMKALRLLELTPPSRPVIELLLKATSRPQLSRSSLESWTPANTIEQYLKTCSRFPLTNLCQSQSNHGWRTLRLNDRILLLGNLHLLFQLDD